MGKSSLARFRHHFTYLVYVASAAMVSSAGGAVVPADAETRADIEEYPVSAIPFGEWPLHQADAGAVEAMFRSEIVRMQARFGDDLDFVCLGYSYGEPTAQLMGRLADLDVPLMGRLACSPERNTDYMSVLVGLSTIRCEQLVCTANSDISFGRTIERGVPISAHRTPDSWAVRLNEGGDD
jgi:hypothetical protein